MREFRPLQRQRLPPVIMNLMIINALMLFFDSIMERQYGIQLSRYLGLHYWTSKYFYPWQLITHMFMHGDFNHLLSNMIALWLFGSMLENIWGPKRFLLFYFFCGLGGALCHLSILGYEFSTIEKAFHIYQQHPTVDQFSKFITEYIRSPRPEAFSNLLGYWENNPGDASSSGQSCLMIQQYLHGGYSAVKHSFYPGIMDVVTIGASGAVFGILFAFGYLFPNTELYMYFYIKAKYLVFIYAVMELYTGFRYSAGDNVAHFAHLGGMLFAFVLLQYWQRKSRNTFY